MSGHEAATSRSNHGDLSSPQTGYKENLVVGDEPCTFVEVRDVLCRCATVDKLWPKLIEVGRSLKIPADTLILLNLRIPTEIVTHRNALVDILEAWRGKFASEATVDKLINVLDTNGVGDCADALRIHFKEFDDAYVAVKLKALSSRESFPAHFKPWLDRKRVKFQGNQVKLEQLTDQISTQVDRKVIDELAAGRTPCIVNDQVPEKLDYYSHRTVISRSILKIDVLKEKCADVFVVEGMEKHQLSWLVKETTDESENQLVRLTVRFILLQHQPDFYAICKIASVPVHWVRHVKGKLKLIKSSGPVENLQKHVDDAQDSFLEDELACISDRVVVIADSPGMGKTCLLANLTRQMMRERPTVVVRFIVLKEFVDALAKKKIDTESIVKVIAESSSENEFGRKFVEYALLTQECVLLFDGFDEVLPKQMTTAKQILRAVVSLFPSARVFVATRPHFRDDVENLMYVLSYTIHPFDKANQVIFLIKFWKMKGAATNDYLTQFANECVEQLSTTMTDSELNIAANPLQCKLIAETYEDHAIRRSKCNEQLGGASNVIINSIFGIYEKHMEMRFEKIRKQDSLIKTLLSKLTRKNQYETIKNTHMYFALELLFPDHVAQFKGLNASSIPVHELYGLGILEAVHSKDIRFVHRTFAEFLVAMLAQEYIDNVSPNRDLLLSAIFKLTPQNQDLYNPFGVDIKLKSFVFDFSVICYFLNGLTKKDAPTQPAIEYYGEMLPFYYASAFHNYDNIPVIMTRSVASMNPIQTDELNTRDLLYVAARYSGVELMTTFCSNIEITKISFLSIPKFYNSEAYIITPLHVAVCRGHYRLVEFLLNKFGNTASQLRYLIHFCVRYTEDNNNAIVKDRVQIIKLLSKTNQKWVDEQLPDKAPPLMQQSVHADLLVCLVQAGAKLNIRDERGNTVLHQITQRTRLTLTSESYDKIVNALNQHGFQLFNAPNKEQATPIHYSIRKVELLDKNLEFFNSKGADFNAVDERGESLIFYAIRGRWSAKLISKLINLGAKTGHCNWKGQNGLHISILEGNLDALIYFIQVQNINVNERDANGNTPLHLAMLQSRGLHTESMQLLLIKAGADVNAKNDLHNNPFMEAFERYNPLTLNVIKEMEKHGLNITKQVASNALTSAFLEIQDYSYKHSHVDVLEYLIEKGGCVHFEFSHNFWKWTLVQQAMPHIIQNTHLTLKLLAASKERGILTLQDYVELENVENSVKSQRFYEIVQEKAGSFERVYVMFRSDRDQEFALEVLLWCMKCARDKLSSQVFVTAIPRLKQLIDSNVAVVTVVTKSPELSAWRIRDTVDYQMQVVEEYELEEASIRGLSGLVILKCDTMTTELVNKLVCFQRPFVCVCKHIVDGVKGCEIVTDTFEWADVSSKLVRNLWVKVGGDLHNLAELFATPIILGELGKLAMEFHHLQNPRIFTLIKCKVGHEHKHLSTEVFSHFLPDKLVFVNINERDLKMYANYGQRIGDHSQDIQSLDYVILPDEHLFDKVCKQVSPSVHLIEHDQGRFKIVRTWGSDKNLQRFYERCEFPFCNCPVYSKLVMRVQVSHKTHTINLKGNGNKRETITIDLKVDEVRPEGLRVLKAENHIDLYELRNLMRQLDKALPDLNISVLMNELDGLKPESKSTQNIICELVERVINPEHNGDLQQVAINTLFPNLFERAKSICGGVEKYVHLLENGNNVLVFKLDVLASYFIAEMIVEKVDSLCENEWLSEIFLNCFAAHADQIVFHVGNNSEYRTKSIPSYKFKETRLFQFLDFFASKHDKADAVSSLLTKIVKPDSVEKWVHASVNDDLVNLLQIIVKLGVDKTISGDVAVLGIIHGNVPLIQLVTQEYKDELIKIRIPLFECDYDYYAKYGTDRFLYYLTLVSYSEDAEYVFARLMHVLDVAAMKRDQSVFEYLITHHFNQPEMNHLVYYLCVAHSHEHDEIDGRKRIITDIFQNITSMKKIQTNALLAPNIHADLIIHVISLGVDVYATDKYNRNILHLCAEYLKPSEYDRVVNTLFQNHHDRLFQCKDENQNTPLHIAASYMELLHSTISVFSSANVDFNSVNQSGNTVLHQAVVSNRSARLLNSLTNSGADEEARGWNNRTVLHAAAEFGNFTAIKYFILCGHDVNETDKHGSTPLHLALEHPATHTHQIVVLLVEHGADAFAIDKDHRTPISIANNPLALVQVQARTKEYLESIVEMMEILIKWESEIISNNINKLCRLTRCDSQLLHKLYRTNILTEIDINELESMETNNLSRADKFYRMLLTKKCYFKVLLKLFYESNNTGAVRILTKELISTLYNAVLNLHLKLVKFVMRGKGYVLEPFMATLELLDREEYAHKLSLLSLLCTLNPKVLPPKRAEMYTPLQLALVSHHGKQFEFVQKIISHNVDVNERDSRGWTPLHYAVRQAPVPPRLIQIVKLLIESGADPDTMDDRGLSFLHWAPYTLTPDSYDELIQFFDSSGRKESLQLFTPLKHSHLHISVFHFDPLPSTLEMFKSNGIDFNGQDINGNSVVFNAIGRGRNAEFLKILLKVKYGADWNIRNNKQENPLHVAALYGNVSALELFIELGCEVNAKNNEGRTPLHNAFLGKEYGETVRTNHEIVGTLLEHGADVNAIDNHQQTPLDIANRFEVETRTKEFLVQFGAQSYQSIVQTLLDQTYRKWKSGIINNIGKFTIYDSAYNSAGTSLNFMELICEGNGSVEANKVDKMVLTKENDLKMILKVLQDTNNTMAVNVLIKEVISTLYDYAMNRNYPFLHFVIKSKRVSEAIQPFVKLMERTDRHVYAEKLSIIQFLAMKNPDLVLSERAKMYTPVQLALTDVNHEKQFELIQMLIGDNADVNERDSRGWTPLHYVVLQKPVPPRVIEIVKLLIESGADPDAFDKDGRTFVHWAPQYLTPDLYDKLIEFFDSCGRKHSIQLRDSHNNTHLHLAVCHFDPLPRTLKIFKRNGIDFNDEGNGSSVVFCAIFGGRSGEFLRTLFGYGADWKIPNSDNYALYLAVVSGNVSALKLFIELGCDVNAKDDLGQTPLHYALSKTGEKVKVNHEMVVTLVEHGADVNAITNTLQTPLDLAVGNSCRVETETKEFLIQNGAHTYQSIMEMLEKTYIKWKRDLISDNMDKLTSLTNLDSPSLLRATRILTPLQIEELNCVASKEQKFYNMLLDAQNYDLQLLLKVLYETSNIGGLNILVKELINTLFDALMNRNYQFLHYIIQTKHLSRVLQPFLNAIEQHHSQQCTQKITILEMITSLQFLKSPTLSPLKLMLLTHHEKQFELIQMLISHDVDVNERHSKGFTPLNYAVQQKPAPPLLVEIVKLLIENGADPDVVDEQGRTFLHWAPYFLTPEMYDKLIAFFDSSGRKEFLKLLTHHNHSHLHLVVVNFEPLPSTINIFKSNAVDFNGQDKDGDSVLFVAIEGGRNAGFIRTLLSYGADWNIPNNAQENALHVAALFGNVSALELFISLGCDVNAKNKFGRTPLHNAFLAKKNGKEIMSKHGVVVLLLKEQVDVAAKDDDGKTPVDLARERLQTGKVKLETVEVLENYSINGVEEMENVKSHDQIELREKEHLKHVAEMQSSFVEWESDIIRSNMEKLINLTYCDSGFLNKFTSSGILTELDVEESIEQGTSHASTEERFYTVLLLSKEFYLEILLNVFYETNQAALSILTKEIISTLLDAVMNRKYSFVYYVMETKVFSKVLQSFLPTLEDAEREQCAEKLRLMQMLCTINPQLRTHTHAETLTPLQLAILCGHHEKQLELIKMLIAHNADVNERDVGGLTPLHYAVLQMNVPNRVVEIIKLLIENGANPDVGDKKARTFLHWAPYFLTPELYDKLVEFFASSGRIDSLQLRDSHNSSHLHLAVRNFEPLPDTLNIFKFNGVDFNGQDNDGDCVVLVAIAGGRSAEFILTLFEHGADWNIQNNKQENTLHVAALYGNVSALELFIALGVDVNATNKLRRNPLHNAFLGKNDDDDVIKKNEIVDLLLNEGADVTATDANGQTPIDLANQQFQT